MTKGGGYALTGRGAVPVRRLLTAWRERWRRAMRCCVQGPAESAVVLAVMPRECFHEMKGILQFVDRVPAPTLLPILRSQQQGEILALLLGDPDQELSLTDIARLTGAPHPSVFREVERAEQAGLVTSRKVGNTRPVRADTTSPYYAGLAGVLTRPVGGPPQLAQEPGGGGGIAAGLGVGSTGAGHSGEGWFPRSGQLDD